MADLNLRDVACGIIEVTTGGVALTLDATRLYTIVNLGRDTSGNSVSATVFLSLATNPAPNTFAEGTDKIVLLERASVQLPYRTGTLYLRSSANAAVQVLATLESK